jgi:hypothetical protein
MVYDALNSNITLNRIADIVIVGSGAARITLVRELEW